MANKPTKPSTQFRDSWKKFLRFFTRIQEPTYREYFLPAVAYSVRQDGRRWTFISCWINLALIIILALIAVATHTPFFKWVCVIAIGIQVYNLVSGVRKLVKNFSEADEACAKIVREKWEAEAIADRHLNSSDDDDED